MSKGSLFKIKHSSGRILGPLDLDRIKKLILKNQIRGTELARSYPEGDWKDINQHETISDLLLKHAQGTLDQRTKITLASEQSSYRPILAQTRSNLMAPTVLLNPEEGKKLAESAKQLETEIKINTESTTHRESIEEPVYELEAGVEKRREEIAAHEESQEGSRTVLVGGSEEEDQTELNPIKSYDLTEQEKEEGETGFWDQFLPSRRKSVEYALSNEETILIDRSQDSSQKPKKKKNKKTSPIRLILIVLILGYFFLDDEWNDRRSSGSSIFLKTDTFKPRLPVIDANRVNPQESQKYYQEAMKIYVLDHELAYKGAALKLLQSTIKDPENVKALAMLASCYIHLIDSSNKDESYFSVISKLIEMSKAKGVDLPEVVIADVEFFMITNRVDAAINRIVEYTKSNPQFDPSMFYYLSEAFYEKGDYANAAKYLAFFPDNRAFSPSLFYLRGLISEALKSPAEAVSYYKKALNMSKTHAKSRLRWVALNSEEGKLLESRDQIETLIRESSYLSPKDLAQAYFYYGKFFQLQEDWGSALSALEHAVLLNPKNHDYRLEYYTLKARSGELVPTAKQDAQMYFYLGEGEKRFKEGKNDEALTEFLRARSAKPTSVQPLIRIGEMFLHLNDMISARINFKKAAELAPNNIEIWSKYIYVLIQSYEWDEAQKAMARFRKLPVSQSAIDKAAGDLYAKQNRHVEAQNFYKKAMMREVIDPDVYIAYAKSLMATKNFKEAPFFFSLAQRFDPLNIEAILGIAQATAQSESIDAGIRMLESVLHKGGFPTAAILSGISEFYIQKGEWGEAQKTLEQAKKADPEYAYPWKLQAQIYMNEEYVDKKALDRALSAYKSYSDRNTSDPSGYLERYRIFIKKAQFEKANDELDRIYSIYPKYPNLHFYKGAMYAAMGNHKVAAEEYRSELENNTHSVQTMVALGRELLELDDAKSAISYLTKAMSLDPRNAMAKFYAANANRRLKNFQGAIALYQEAIKIDSGNPSIYKKMGECYIEMGDTMNGQMAFRKYIEMEPDAQDRSEIERYL